MREVATEKQHRGDDPLGMRGVEPDMHVFGGAPTALRSFFVRRKFAAQRSIDGGADSGVDLVLTKEGKRFLVQCKQYRALTVSVMVVREIFGIVAAQRAAGVMVVTTGTFTKDVIEFARAQPIDLIDGRQRCRRSISA